MNAVELNQLQLQPGAPPNAMSVIEASVHRPKRGTRWVASFRDETGQQCWKATGQTDRQAALVIAQELEREARQRRTFEVARQGPGATLPGMKTVVCSRTLQTVDDPDLTLTGDAVSTATALKSRPGKDIWLFGGAALFRSLLDAEVVDRVEVSIIPILLSQGIPLLPAGRRSPRLRLEESKTTPSGIVGLTYAVEYVPA